MTVLLMTDNGYFLLPGGTPISAQLQFARTVARRAERRLWTLHRQDPRERGYSALHQPPFGLVLRHGPHGDAAAGLAGGEMARVCLQKEKTVSTYR